MPPWGTGESQGEDLNIYLVPVTGGPSVVITAANRGADQNPVYTPDGRYIAYSSSATNLADEDVNAAIDAFSTRSSPATRSRRSPSAPASGSRSRVAVARWTSPSSG